MAGIKTAERFAFNTFAPNHPYIAVDPYFSSSANLDIFQLDFISDDPHLPLVGSCSTFDRFNCLAWSKPISDSDEFSLGLVAGGFSDGSIVVWNPKKLIEPETELELQTDASVGRFEKHTSLVRGLEFCTKSNALSSGADEGLSVYGTCKNLLSLYCTLLWRALEDALKPVFHLCPGTQNIHIY